LFTGYIDDSGNLQDNIFTLSCITGHPSYFNWFRVKWEYVLEVKNRQLKLEGRTQVSRFHAYDVNERKGDFKGWGEDERLEFMLSLLDVFRFHNFVIFSCTVNLNDLVAEFPQAKNESMAFAHAITLFRIMELLSEKVLSRWNQDYLQIVHDRGSYDKVLRNAFDLAKKESTIIHGNRFATIESKGWEEEPLLQPADFIAYENYKLAMSTQRGSKIRPCFQAILDLVSFGGRGMNLIPSELQRIRTQIGEESLERLFLAAGIKKPETKKKPSIARAQKS
jgi:Protein of unknown function (DUF3800)